jgi:sulfur carrier protein ThiS
MRKQMIITIEKTGEKKELAFRGTAAELLKELQINHTTVIVAADKKLVALSKDISDAHTIEILSVISGG